MFSKSLLKATIKQNYIVFLIILAVMMMYITIIAGMYDPSIQDTLDEMLKMMPKELMSAMGFTSFGNTLLEFISSYFYGFLILLLPMIYTIVVANRSIASHVDRGSMACLLSTPNTRMKIARTQAFFLLVSITLLIGFLTLAGVGMSVILFPGELDIPGFLLLNLGALILYYALTGLGFFASCLFNDTKNSLAIGAGLPVAFLVLQMLSNVGDKTDFLKYFTLYTLFDPEKIVQGEGYILSFIVLFLVALVTYSGGLYVFNKRDLPL
ncbi:ABC transporter permease subunit [Mobilitalea sibirica]|uniref:ABC transporter permease subunit n=1 Tax=Mobilitalea sibirica TaxID=1462919 RepID=A0A8J7HE32_9FIRM|nr:ABC transporter permease subunit [Mobilitalea sibirica]MBH1941539.1 ABC transporter permease subunit [Mobilitalea sibirica]